jgi:NmrA-like family
MSQYLKKVPSSIAIFGASGHIGGAAASWLAYHAPQVKLRLISSNDASAARLRDSYPGAEVVVANYLDAASLETALAGIEGVFAMAAEGLPQEVCAANLAQALQASGSLVHLIYAQVCFSDLNISRMTDLMHKYRFGEPIGRKIMEESGLPVTVFNLGATFIDNFLTKPMLSPGKLTWANRRVPWIDPREIGEAAARLLISDDARHLYQFQTLNNGQDKMDMADAVQMMSDVLKMDITLDCSREGLTGLFEPAVKAGHLPPDLPQLMWDFFTFEDAYEHTWSRNDFLESVLGRKPLTVRAWMQEHRNQLLAKLRPEG